MENHLLSRIITGEATSEEKEAFYRHLGDNKEDEDLFYQIKSLWVKSSIPTDSANQEAEFERIWNTIKPEVRRPGFTIGTQFLKIAAVVLVVFSLGGIIGYLLPDRKPQFADSGTQKYTALKGSVSIIEMQDGTKIWLNSGSELLYRENHQSHQREAELRGEAFFEVKHRADFPLLVKAGSITVRDLGTTFNIKAYPEDPQIETSLFEGAASVLTTEEKTGIELRPGQSAIYDSSAKKIKLLTFSQNIISAWKDGKFVIRDQRLEDIFKELSRWYDVEFKFENNALRDYRYTGNIRKSTTPQHVLKMLKQTTNFNYRIIEKSTDSDVIVIY